MLCETGIQSFVALSRGKLPQEKRGEDRVHLRAVDSVEVTIVVDNSIDLLLTSQKQIHRQTFSPGWSKRPQLLAEHGYSALLTFRKDGQERSFLYDAGLTPETLLHNLDGLGIDLKGLEAIVLSHGHSDHHGGLQEIVRRIGKKKLPLVLHPDAWMNRKIRLPSGLEFELPPPDRKSLEREDVEILEQSGPSFLIGETALVTGQVERTTDFEKGLPSQYSEEKEGWVPDPWVLDDQGIVCNVKGKGLLVVSSCSHSGVINILRNAQKITGVDKIHAFVGGLHLPGSFEQIIPQTIGEMETIRPDVIVPGHCSGWKGIQQVALRMPDAFVPSSVGTRIHFG